MFGVTRRTPRDPWAELFYNLQRRMGRLLNEPLMATDYEWQLGDVATAAWTPVVDIFEEPEHVRIVAEQIVRGTRMRIWRNKRDHRVGKHQKIRPATYPLDGIRRRVVAGIVVGPHRCGQMSASREAHDPYAIRPDPKLFSP